MLVSNLAALPDSKHSADDRDARNLSRATLRTLAGRNGYCSLKTGLLQTLTGSIGITGRGSLGGVAGGGGWWWLVRGARRRTEAWRRRWWWWWLMLWLMLWGLRPDLENSDFRWRVSERGTSPRPRIPPTQNHEELAQKGATSKRASEGLGRPTFPFAWGAGVAFELKWSLRNGLTRQE
jgi:hypothetical protein